MRNGRRLFLIHFGVLSALALFVTPLFHSLVGSALSETHRVLVGRAIAFAFFGYMFSILLGIFFRKGPLKRIGVELAKDHATSLEELKPEQPWDQNS